MTHTAAPGGQAAPANVSNQGGRAGPAMSATKAARQPRGSGMAELGGVAGRAHIQGHPPASSSAVGTNVNTIARKIIATLRAPRSSMRDSAPAAQQGLAAAPSAAWQASTQGTHPRRQPGCLAASPALPCQAARPWAPASLPCPAHLSS